MTITASGMLVLVAAALVAVGGGALVLAYNRLVRRRNLVAEGKSGIDVQLKRRHELIPALVACVKSAFAIAFLKSGVACRSVANCTLSFIQSTAVPAAIARALAWVASPLTCVATYSVNLFLLQYTPGPGVRVVFFLVVSFVSRVRRSCFVFPRFRRFR